MIKKIFFLISFILFLSTSLYAASTGNSSDGNDYAGGKTKYKKASLLIKDAKKLEKKNKVEKAKKKYKKALKYLVETNKSEPNKPDTLNYLGYASRKLGNFEIAEKYYLEGLSIDPNHIGINEYLGELYVITNRIDKAIERLEVLENCNCEEYSELQTLISKN